jgi:hypothetical protein
MAKSALAVLLAVIALSTAIGFALGSTQNPLAADAASTNDVVNQLKSINSQLSTLNGRIGATRTSAGSVRGQLTIICDYTAPIDC